MTNVTVLDPDGWDRKDVNFLHNWENVLIDFNTFWDRLTLSTVSRMVSDKESLLRLALTNLEEAQEFKRVLRHGEWWKNNPQPPTTFQLREVSSFDI
jgi:hypothetical protein